MRKAPLTVAVLLALVAPRAAQAQSFALPTYDPTPAGDRFFAIEAPEAPGHARLDAMVLADYARAPLAIYDNTSDELIGNLVSDQMFVHVALSLALYNRLLLSIDAPFAVVSEGTALPGAPAVDTGAAVGDLRTGLRLRVLGDPGSPFQVALAGQVWLPTGDERHLAGEGEVRGRPELVLGGKIGAFVWAVNGGVAFRPSEAFLGTTLGPQLTFGGAVGGLFAKETLQLGLEAYGSSVLATDASPPAGSTAFTAGEVNGRTTNLELLLGARLRMSSFVLGGAAGPGLAGGIGTPTFRGIVSLAYAPVEGDRDGDGVADASDRCPDQRGSRSADPAQNGCPAGVVIDRDGDGILDAEDACPDQAGVRAGDFAMNGCPDSDGDAVLDKLDACPTVAGIPNEDPKKTGCPFADRDQDTIEDDDDACPETAGVAQADAKKNGCPSDKDEDGFVDAADACPDIKGVADADPKKNGCPPDTDRDGVRDDLDACPGERGPASGSRAQNGCPAMVRFAPPRIVTLQPVPFTKDKDVLAPEAEAVLTDVAGVLADHPEVSRVAIEAHTDDKGPKPAKKKLSEKRAAAVVKWLVEHGVAEGRLEAKGFGGEVPIADNKTEEGRAKNQRIEIRVVAVAAPAPAPATPAPPGGAEPPEGGD